MSTTTKTKVRRKQSERPKMTRENDQRGIYDLDQLPATGLILHQDFLTFANTDRRVVPFSKTTWRRAQLDGTAPPSERFFGREAQHAEHIRAIALGQDWRSVEIADA